MILLAPRDVEGLLAEHQTFATPTAGAGLEQRLRAKLADWRGLLTQNVESGREVLRSLLVGPLRFTPVNEARRVGYAFEGSIALDRLVSGVIELVPRTGVASPKGLAPFSVVNGSVVRPAAETRLFGNGRAAAAKCLDAAANQPLKDLWRRVLLLLVERHGLHNLRRLQRQYTTFRLTAFVRGLARARP